MLDAQNMTLWPHFELAGGLAFRNLGVERRPFRAPLAALKAEARLLAGVAAIALDRVDGHVAGVAFLVAELVGTGFQNLEVVVAWQARQAVGAGHAHLRLGLGIIRLEFGEGDGPVEKIGTGDLAVGRERAEFVLLKPQRRAGPVRRRAADRFHDPRRQIGEILGDAPRARRRARIGPRELREARPFVIDEILVFVALARLEDHHVDALLGQFVAERPATGTRADDDDDVRIILSIPSRHDSSSPEELLKRARHSQSMSSKPRWM